MSVGDVGVGFRSGSWWLFASSSSSSIVLGVGGAFKG